MEEKILYNDVNLYNYKFETDEAFETCEWINYINEDIFCDYVNWFHTNIDSNLSPLDKPINEYTQKEKYSLFPFVCDFAKYSVEGGNDHFFLEWYDRFQWYKDPETRWIYNDFDFWIDQIDSFCFDIKKEYAIKYKNDYVKIPQQSIILKDLLFSVFVFYNTTLKCSWSRVKNAEICKKYYQFIYAYNSEKYKKILDNIVNKTLYSKKIEEYNDIMLKYNIPLRERHSHFSSKTFKHIFGNKCSICGIEEPAKNKDNPFYVDMGKYHSFFNLHHIIPLKDGGTNKASNMLLLCKNCHDKIHLEGNYTLQELQDINLRVLGD